VAELREIRIRDTLSGTEQVLPEGEVGIYACGPTVYSRIHVGNARQFVVFMLLRRFLESEGYRPKLVINVTDVNDKIYAAAVREGVSSAEHAAEMTRMYFEDTGKLGLGRPDVEPLATETMAEIIALIEKLIADGHAYESGGDVYFSVRSFDGYGKLSNRDPDDMDQGEEAGSASLKRDALDFALWKAHKAHEDTKWDSPWGPGRPGWHIECSAMAEKYLGVGFAIHGGGSDLVFPHHENEIAQSEAAHNCTFARIWMHGGMVRVADEKMSKSVGNIFNLAEAIETFGAPVVISFLISGHYRQPLEFSEAAMEQAAARLDRIRNFLVANPADGGTSETADGAMETFRAALADDFNTPKAIATMFELIGDANRNPVPGAAATVADMARLLGLDAVVDEAAGAGDADSEAERLLAERQAAREARDFARADEIRDRLAELGYEVRDGADGARLVRIN